jgi:hypothetical protein
VLDSTADVREIARRHSRRHIPANLCRFLDEIFLGEREAKQAADLTVDHPVGFLGFTFRLEQHRTKLIFRRREVVPSLRTFDHMSICVYPSHG